MLYLNECMWQEIIDSQLVIDNHQQWIQYISWVIDLRFVDHASSELTSVSSSACWTVLAAVWCRSSNSDRLLSLELGSWSQSSYWDNDESDLYSWFESALQFDS